MLDFIIMRIREAAERSGVSAPTIRYYEQLGLLGVLRRTQAGYRVFDEHAVRQLVFLRKARDLGFSLEDCRELLDLVTAANRRTLANAERKRAVAVRRLADIDAQISELRRVRELIQLHIDTLRDPNLNCPVADNL